MGIQREQQRALSLRMARHEMLQSGLELDFRAAAPAPVESVCVSLVKFRSSPAVQAVPAVLA
jgi:hypothetical protein